ncbi:MAG: antibiotic biosynthesis monooxygenase, partial [Acidobacteria bacterium]|nr:antibiotic biosynthesis monooxygenase [Acidobacteriota bacterium]
MRIAGSNLHKLPYIVVREFRVRPGRRRAFEKAYGPCGDWLRLFQRKPGHIRSELVPDRERPLRYLTLDFWTSRKSYEHFMTQDQAEYQRIHQRCSRLTVSETLIGEFDDLALGPAGQDLPGPLAIRAASNGDISGMIEVAREISTCAQWPHSVYEKIFDANPLHRLAFVLARQNCAVEGFIVASLGGETCEVENLVVASTLAGQGWGKRLFD